MAEIGKTLLFFGFGSMVLYFLEMEFILMMWVDHWGAGVGWMIRTAMVVAGLLMVLKGANTESAFD